MKKFVVIKIGGKPANDPALLDALIGDIGDLAANGPNGEQTIPVLVHGGGADVTELSKRLGLEPSFVGGKRMTSPAEMQIVEAVLAGNVNCRILRRFLAAGIPAVGLCGVDAGLFTGESIDDGSRTGSITATRPGVLEHLAAAGYISVVSSVSCEADGSAGLNINADDAAMALAVALQADCLVFLSDIPGILKENHVLTTITPTVADTEIAAGVITGGMIPKVQSSLGALNQGIGRVVIGGYNQRGDLKEFLAGRRGTSIVA